MPETYTGDEGDGALDAGLDIMDGGEKWFDGWRAINKTRDYIVQLFNSVQWSTLVGKPSTFPPSSHVHPISQITTETGDPYGPALQSVLDGMNSEIDSVGAAAASANANANARLLKSGDTMSGPLFLPSSYPATSGYTVAYIDFDGRVSRGASSAEFKHDIAPLDPASLGDIFPPLKTFVMNDDPTETERVGYIAQDLAGHPDLDRFVVYLEGEPYSIDFISLLMAEVAQLRQEVKELRDGSTD